MVEKSSYNLPSAKIVALVLNLNVYGTSKAFSSRLRLTVGRVNLFNK
jgi:hypothetical protein